MDKETKNIYILAIETSCDETAAAVVKNGREVISNIISSQIELHKEYGGVVPEIASRKHIEAISYIIEDAMDSAGMAFRDLDAIGVTCGPGLVGALLVGVSTAKGLAYGLDLPLVGVNHIEGHICANYIAHRDLEPPFLCLVVSGGHSHIIMVDDYGEYRKIGQTRDDAVGEAFDKVARTLDLEYPGGPIIDRIAKDGDPYWADFPHGHIEDHPYDFSFSGVKTSVINHLHNMEQKGETYRVEDVAASFQRAVVDVLVEKTMMAARDLGVDKIALAGGVSANSKLRSDFKERCEGEGIELYYPPIELCTDNAAMIGSAAYYNFIHGDVADLTLNAYPNLPIV